MVRDLARNHFRIHTQIYDQVYSYFPHFDDLFDEESFYLFAVGLTITAIFVCVVFSRKITLREVDF